MLFEAVTLQLDASKVVVSLSRGVEITMANVYNALRLEAVLPPEPRDIHSDSAFASGKSGCITLSNGRLTE